MKHRLLQLCLLALATPGLATAPYVPPPAPIPATWPSFATPVGETAEMLPWRALIRSAKMQALVDRALADNRDLRSRLSEIAAAQASYAVQRSAQRPMLAFEGQALIVPAGGQNGFGTDVYQAGLTVPNFDFDPFGRLRKLSHAEFENYLATEAGERAARDTLVAAVARALVALAADRALIGVAQAQVDAGEQALRLTQSLANGGLSPLSDVDDARTIVAQARSDLAALASTVQQDQDEIALLVGGPIAADALDVTIADLDRDVLRPPAGVRSDVLLGRPDVAAAEHQLAAADYNVQAARAAFLPSITLTGVLGVASAALGTVLTGGAVGISLLPSLVGPIAGGPTRPAYRRTLALRESALATYQAVAQGAFRDVADDLARLGTIGRQRTEQADLVASAARSHRLSLARYQAGTETFLSTLIAQRALYAARRSEIATIAIDIDARLSLEQHLGAQA